MELKFRVWDKNIPTDIGFTKYGEMIQWDYVVVSSYLRAGLNGEYPMMQFTGMKDKNGVDIYEGDIVENEYKHRFSVNWATGEYMCWYFNGNLNFMAANRPDIQITVIGNIHQNPELCPTDK